MRIKKELLLTIWIGILQILAGNDFMYGEISDFKILPWNGKEAAVSLTFDDGDPSHLELAIPELDKRDFKGTFNIIANKITQKEQWKKVFQNGHKLGNHSSNHRRPLELSEKDMEYEVNYAHNYLENIFKVKVITFAYPFSQTTPKLENKISQKHIAARSGAGSLYYIPYNSDPDWYNLPSYTTLTATPAETYIKILNNIVKKESWLIFMIHGLEGTPWGWQPIPKKNYIKILDYLYENREEIWVDPFGEIASYFRDKKIIEKSSYKNGIYKWNVPSIFPENILIKVRLINGTVISQKGNKLLPDKNGIYTINFNDRSLSINVH